jgi:hypothetical protein
MKSMFVAVLPFVVAMGCTAAQSSFTPTNQPPHKLIPRPAESVEMFVATSPERKFVEVGLLHVNENDERLSRGELLLMLRKRAAIHGCDAVVIGGSEVNVRSSHVSLWTDKDHTVSDHGYYGACVVYTDDQATTEAVAQRDAAQEAKAATFCEREKQRARQAPSGKGQYEILRKLPSHCFEE